MSQTKTDKEIEYPKVGDMIELRVGQKGELIYFAVYVVEQVQKQAFTADLRDVRVAKKSDLPI